MKNKNRKNQFQKIFFILLLLIAGSLPTFVIVDNVSAIVCPDGQILPDERANECVSADASGTGGGNDGASTGELCDSATVDSDECKSVFSDKSKGCNDSTLTSDNCRIVEYLVIGINFLAAIAGIVFVFSIMFSGFQYMTARDNAGQIEKAKSRIVMTLIAIAVFIFMYSLLNFLIPGGVL